MHYSECFWSVHSDIQSLKASLGMAAIQRVLECIVRDKRQKSPFSCNSEPETFFKVQIGTLCTVFKNFKFFRVPPF